MRTLTLALALFLTWPALGWAQSNTNTTPPSCTVAQLTAGTCAPARQGSRATVTDGSSPNDCTTGGSSTSVVCEYNGSAWAAAAAPYGSLSPGSIVGAINNVMFCGELNESGTIYFGPALEPWNEKYSTNSGNWAAGSNNCNGLDSATEATADNPLFTNVSISVLGMWCNTTATLGSGETIVFTLDNDTVATNVTCTVSEGETDCASSNAVNGITGGAPLAIKAVETSDNANGDDGWCRVTITPGS